MIVANPPYGERLSDQASVRQLYKQMGQVYQRHSPRLILDAKDHIVA